MSNPTLLLVELLQTTLSMLEAAEIEDWKKVGEIESKRQFILKSLAATVGSLDGEKSSTEAISKHVREALKLNNRIIELGLEAKVKLSERIGNVQRGRKAMNVYYGMK